MSANIRFPNITGATEAEQINQIKSYLHQLVQQLNWALSTIESGTGSASPAEPSMGDISEQTFYELKSLLIQSSDMLNGYYDKINHKLEGHYVLQSTFSSYQQSVSWQFGDLGNQFVSQADYSKDKQQTAQNFAELDDKYVSQTDFDAYKQEVAQHVDGLKQSIEELCQMINDMQNTGGV